VPQTVIAEIGSGPRVVGAKSLRAIGNVIAARPSLHGYRAVIDITIVIIAGSRRVVARSAVIALRGDRAANDCAGHGTRNETTATAAVTVIAATAATAIDTATAAAKPRAGRTATTDDATAATIKPRGNCSAAAATTTGSAADGPLPGAGRRLRDSAQGVSFSLRSVYSPTAMSVASQT